MTRKSKNPPAFFEFARPQTVPVPPPAHLWFVPTRHVAYWKARELTGRASRTLDRWRAQGITDQACLGLLQAHTYGLIPHARWQGHHVTADGDVVAWLGSCREAPILPDMGYALALAHQAAADARSDLRRLQREAADSLWQADDPAQLGLFVRATA